MPNEIETLARNRIDADQARFPIAIEQFKFYVWTVRVLLAGVILGTLWYARVESKLKDYDKMAQDYIPAIAANSAYITSNNLVNLSVQNQIDSLRGRVVVNEGSIAAILPKLSELWFLKEHGVDNSTELIRKQMNPNPTPKPTPNP